MDFKPYTHFKIVCECGDLISQCRCPSTVKLVKTITHEDHEEIEAAFNLDPPPADPPPAA